MTAQLRRQRHLAFDQLEDRTLLSVNPLSQSYLKAPLSFEANLGQTDSQVQFLARGQGYGLFLTGAEAVLSLHSPGGDAVLRAQFLGANPSPQGIGLDPQTSKSNYFIGNDPSQWHSDVTNYSRILYPNLYPGIDLVYYGTNQQQLEYDFIVAPGVDPSTIRVAYEGANSLELDKSGNLILHTSGGDVVQHAPVVYQEIGGKRKPVTGSFVVEGNHVGFALGAYDISQPLVIDPVLAYSTYLGGSSSDAAFAVATDSSGNIYVTGRTSSANFPLAGAFDSTIAASDAFVTKVNATGTAIVYSTFVGGSGDDNGTGTFGGDTLFVDAAGNAYVGGFTNSNNFPTATPVQPTRGGALDAYLLQLNPAGNALVFSTYLGGSGDEYGGDITVDSGGNIYYVGHTFSSNFPVTAGSFQTSGSNEGFVTKLNPSGSAMIFSTYVGGSGDDIISTVAVDAANNVIVGGFTFSSDYPTTAGLDRTLGGPTDLCLTKLNAAGNGLIFSTYIGGSGDDGLYRANGVSQTDIVMLGGNIYLGSFTASSDFPTTAGAFDTSSNGGADVVVMEINGTTGTTIYSSYLGGAGDDVCLAVEVNAAGEAYVSGFTESVNFPTLLPTQTTRSGPRDAFLSYFNAAGSALSFSTYFGGPGSDHANNLAVGPQGQAYLVGFTNSTALPTQNPLQPAAGGGGDAFAAVFANPVAPAGTLYGITASGTLVRINTTTGVATAVGNVAGVGPSIGLANRAGRLYSWQGGPRALHEIDPLTATRIATTTFPAPAGGLNEGDLAFRADGIGFLSDAATATQMYSIDPTVPLATLIGPTNAGAGNTRTLDGMAFNASGTLFAVSESSGLLGTAFGAPEPNTLLYTVNTTTGALTTIGNTGISGSLEAGLTFDASGTLYMAISTTAGNSQLYTVNTTTGLATLIGPVGAFRLVGIAFGASASSAGVTITQSGGSTNVTEGGTTDAYTVVLNSAPTANVTITVANPSSQVLFVPATLTFTPANWSTPQTVTVTAVDDAAVEGAHVGVITHTAASSDTSYSGITIANVTANITDNDSPAQQLYGITFGAGNQLITIDTTTGAGTAVGALTSTMNAFGIAARGNQLYAWDQVIGRLREIDPATGATIATIDLGIAAATEGDIVFRSDGIGFMSTAGAPPTLIRFDLTVPSATVVGNLTPNMDGLAFNSAGVLYGMRGSGNQLYTIDPTTGVATLVGNTGIPAAGDDVGGLAFDASDNLYAVVARGIPAGPSRLFRINPTTAAATLIGNVGINGLSGIRFSVPATATAGVTITQSAGSTNVTEGGSSDSYTVVLTAAPTANVTITVASPAGQVLFVPTTLTFTPVNWNTPQTVGVTAVDDALVEGAHTGVITHTAASTDASYSGITIANVTANITDNDSVSAGVTITQSAGSTNVAEGGATDTYTVVLNTAPSASVTINLAPGTQLNVAPTRLTFTTANWSTPQTVTVTAIDDVIVEGVHTGVITHTAASTDSSYNAIAIPRVTASIADNDAAAPAGVTITQSAGATNIAEGGATDTYTVVLDAPPTADVTIALNPGTQVTTNPTSLTFTTSNWNIRQTVTVTAIDDPVVENTHSGVITHTATSTDTAYDAIAIPDVTAIINDNDFDAGALIINGTEKSDKITLTFATQIIQVAVNGKVTFYPNTYPSVRVIAFAGVNRIQITGATVPVTVTGGSGKDDVVLDGRPAANSFTLGITSVNVNGQDIFLTDVETLLLGGKTAADTFTIQAVPTIAVTIQAGSGKDTLVAPDQVNDWKVTASDAGKLDNTIAFSFIENLTGGSDDDNYWFATGKFVSGQIDGGTGNNVLDYSAHKTALTLTLGTLPTINKTHPFRNIATLIGGAGSDKIIGANASNIWNITGRNAGDIDGLAFTSFENLTGGALDDTFVFADGQSVSGKVDGGLGADTLDQSAFTTALTINLQTKLSTTFGGKLTFANVESFIGGAATDTFIAANRPNLWNITGAGQGTTSGTAFDGFENLTGGSLVDMFNFATGGDWLGLLDGGLGNDILSALPGWTYTLTGPNAGTLNGRNFRGVETRR